MSILEEIEKFMVSAEMSINFRVLNLGGKSLYVEGLKSIVSLNEQEMRFQLKKGLLIVEGSSLEIKYLDKTTCVISGEIKRVETQ